MNHTCLYSPAAEHHRTLAGTHFPPAEGRRLSWPEVHSSQFNSYLLRAFNLQLQGYNCDKFHSSCFFMNTVWLGWLGSLVAKALDLQLKGCEFNSQTGSCRVTTLGKLFAPTCLSRSQWFSDGMIDCGVRGRGQLCLSRQPLRCTALGTGCAPFLQCLGRLSLHPPWDGEMSISFRAE